MRTHISAAFLLVSSHAAAFAQDVIAPPTAAAPTASAPIEERANWCDEYASWLIAMTPRTQAAPTDVRQSQHLEVELNACKIDPQQYERETRAEADAAVEIAQG